MTSISSADVWVSKMISCEVFYQKKISLNAEVNTFYSIIDICVKNPIIVCISLIYKFNIFFELMTINCSKRLMT